MFFAQGGQPLAYEHSSLLHVALLHVAADHVVQGHQPARGRIAVCLEGVDGAAVVRDGRVGQSFVLVDNADVVEYGTNLGPRGIGLGITQRDELVVQ